MQGPVPGVGEQVQGEKVLEVGGSHNTRNRTTPQCPLRTAEVVRFVFSTTNVPEGNTSIKLRPQWGRRQTHERSDKSCKRAAREQAATPGDTRVHALERSTLANNAAGWTCRASTRDKLTRRFVRELCGVADLSGKLTEHHTRAESERPDFWKPQPWWDSCGRITHIAEKTVPGVSANAADTGNCRWKQGEGKTKQTRSAH